jgi:hypothetical protein
MKDKEYDYKIDGDLSYIYLSQKDGSVHCIIIDTNNLERVIRYKYKWNVFFDPCTNSFYVKTTVYLGRENGISKYENMYLHHFILGIEGSIHIDHKNHNRLDNTENNLRPSEHSNNNKSRKGKNSNNSSGYRNVSFILGYYRIQLQIDGRNYMFPEKFTDVDEAGSFAEEMRQKYYGEFAGRS